MSESLFPPFLKWGQFKSKDETNPDTVDLRVSNLGTFETEYSINIDAEQKQNGKWHEVTVPIKSHESKNSSLLQQWTRAVKEGKVKAGAPFQLRTWLGISKNDRPIRRFELRV